MLLNAKVHGVWTSGQVCEVIDEFSLSKLISKQYDFANEDSMLQYYGKQLGLIIDQTPKCHPEMVGEGIEYSWGCGKNHFQAIPIKREG